MKIMGQQQKQVEPPRALISALKSSARPVCISTLGINVRSTTWLYRTCNNTTVYLQYICLQFVHHCTAWRWYSYQQLSSFKVNAKYSTKKFKGVKKVFIISPHSPQEKDNNGEDWPKTIGKGRRLRSHNSGLVFCSKHGLNLFGIQNSLFSNDWGAQNIYSFVNYTFLIYSRTLDWQNLSYFFL